MIIFLAGAHGVGKTFLGKPVAESLGIKHATASALIREGLGSQSWQENKHTSDVEKNQEALITAVSRISKDTPLILDGHFVLRNSEGMIVPLPVDVFNRLSIKSVILMESPSDVVALRLKNRGAAQSLQKIEEMALEELKHAQYVSEQLSITFYRLLSATEEQLRSIIRNTIEQRSSNLGSR